MKKKIKGIARDTLKFILEVSASSHPKEFTGMLYETNQIITDVDVPVVESSHVNEVMDLFTLPVDTHIVGSVRSHPAGGSNHRKQIFACLFKVAAIIISSFVILMKSRAGLIMTESAI